MVILLLGHTGQIGTELLTTLTPLGQVINQHIDITDKNALSDCLYTIKPHIIVNAAAYTSVDIAQTEQDLCMLTNAIALRSLSEIALDIGALLVHYSTDYVFDGSGCLPWSEEDNPNPINIYGQSKLAGEQAITKTGCRHLILRTSWVYGQNSNNFIQKVLQKIRQKQSLSVISDQIGAPTSAKFIAEATALAIQHIIKESEGEGLYHLCCRGETSWFDYAKLIASIAAPNDDTIITPILSKDYQQTACRPLNSRLNTSKFQKTFGLTPPYWQDELRQYLPSFIEI